MLPRLIQIGASHRRSRRLVGAPAARRGQLVVLLALGVFMPSAARSAEVAASVPSEPDQAAAQLGRYADDSGGELAGRYWREADIAGDAVLERPAYCSGTYVLPSFPYPEDSDPGDFPIEGDVGNLAYSLSGDLSVGGQVTLSQGNRRITGRQGEIDRESGEGRMVGQVEIVEPGLVLEGDTARINLSSREASLEGVQFLLPALELRGEAAAITRSEDGRLVISSGRLTRCEPGNRNWHIDVGTLELNPDDIFATARNATVKVGRVPVLYTPYLRFPVRAERQSGVLFPDIGFSEQDGMDIRVPYYLNLAPHYDATLAPRVISDRGFGLEGEFRHLSSWQSTTLTAALLQNDNIFDGTLSRDDAPGHFLPPYPLGEPIPHMVEMVKSLLSAGVTVKIFSARACEPESIPVIQAWAEQHGLGRLEVTNCKDYDLIRFYDDRAIQVLPNQGRTMRCGADEEGA